MNSKSVAMLFVSLLVLLGSADASAAFLDMTHFVNFRNNTGRLTLYMPDGQPFDVRFANANNVGAVIYTNRARRDVVSQAPSFVGKVTQNLFGLPGITSVDKANNGRIVSNQGPFSYLAVHLTENRELFFKFLLGVEDFNLRIDGEKTQIANWRAYNADMNVPVPAAIWLFGSALLGLGRFRSKKALA